MSHVHGSTEKYRWPFSEQRESTPDWSPAASPGSQFSMEKRVRCLGWILQRGLKAVNVPPGVRFPNDVVAALQYILERAREHNVDPEFYEMVYVAHRLFKGHVISRNETNPVIAGETA